MSGRSAEPRHLLGFDWAPNPRRPPDLSSWPFTIPAVAQIVREGGIDIEPGVTFLVGENGSGKSTLVEAFAELYPREGFATSFVAVTGVGASEEDSPFPRHLRVATHRRASPAGFFLRAESMHSFLAGVDAATHQRKAWGGQKMQERSHGESFLAVLRHRFEEVGVYFLDEPEAALSFRSCLSLVKLMDIMRREGSQLIVATHSPILVSLPGATLLELGEHGIRKVDRYDDLPLVQDWRAYLDAPKRFLKHLLADDVAEGESDPER